ncbi:hypothetical protein A9P82_07275 [Arachidicoccus ginsenosidimutans]|nr:hypothetical protein A9P82_07275 [Arachidicoccus sp. BS20]
MKFPQEEVTYSIPIDIVKVKTISINHCSETILQFLYFLLPLKQDIGTFTYCCCFSIHLFSNFVLF